MPRCQCLPCRLGLQGIELGAVITEIQRTGALRAIAELPASGSRPDGWKMLRGAERWWERHVNTGRNDLGRAYARFDTQTRCWTLLVGTKGSQAQDIEWLGRQGR